MHRFPSYFVGLFAHLIAGAIFTVFFGTLFVLGPTYLICHFAGWSFSLKWLYSIVYGIFVLFGTSTLRNGILKEKFSLLRGFYLD